MAEGHSLRCRCCGARLLTNRRGGLELPLALSLGALLLFISANAFPLLELEIQGRLQKTSIVMAAVTLMDEGSQALGLAVLATSVLVPGLVLGVTLYLIAALRYRLRLPLMRPLLLILSRIQPWGMLDVFMLGILVSMVKLAGMANLVAGPGLYAFVPLIFFSAGLAASLEPRTLWDRLEEIE